MKKSVILKYGCAVLIGASMTAVYLLTRDLSGAEPAERYRMLCDAFTIPGVILMLSAVLVWLSNAGSFTGLGYSVHNLFSHLIPGLGLKQERYGDYYERHQKKLTGYGFLLHVGAAFMVVALVFYVLFYCTYEAWAGSCEAETAKEKRCRLVRKGQPALLFGPGGLPAAFRMPAAGETGYWLLERPDAGRRRGFRLDNPPFLC